MRSRGREKKELDNGPGKGKRAFKALKSKKVLPLLMVGLFVLTSLQIGLFMMNDNGPTDHMDTDPTSNYVDNGHLSDETAKAWNDYAGTVDPPDVVTIDPNIAKVKATDDMKRLSELEGKQNFTDTGPVIRSGPASPTLYEDYSLSGSTGLKAADGFENTAPKEVQREVEEGDLVKVIDDKMYILNSYRGLIIVDIFEPEKAHITGTARVVGYPVEMYVVDFLAIITVRADYGFWSDYWAEDGLKAGGNSGTVGTMIYIVHVGDPEAPKVLKIVELEGFASESRRVGHVIYETTSVYNWYQDGDSYEETSMTVVTSIDFGNPKTLGMKDRVKFSGDSNQVHASTSAFYVAQMIYEDPNWLGFSWAWEEEKVYNYHTKVTYLDITDPNGDIRIRDSFRAPGELEDKYQMDEYNGMFRMVTHFWTGVGESKLFIFDVSDPLDITKMGSVLVDDAGSLMATRFAGDRAYTIHLPRAVDPLDVLDLSDPYNPKVCDVFEMPGWVTHMQVFGNKIIALGVDNSGGKNNVAVSLFDVTDPYKVVMEDRVRLGGDRASSTANWEPKALTVDTENNMIIVPFHGNSGDYREPRTGVQIVTYDLEAGDLELRGEVRDPASVDRTRVVGHYILASSYRSLQVIDFRDMDEPEVVKVVDLAVNIVDVIPMGSRFLQVTREIDSGEVTLRSVNGPDDLRALGTLSVSSYFGEILETPYGPVLITNEITEDEINGTYYQTGSLDLVQMTRKGRIVLTRIGSLAEGDGFLNYNNYYRGEYRDHGAPIMDSKMIANDYYYYGGGMDEGNRLTVIGDALVYYHVGPHASIDYIYISDVDRYVPTTMEKGDDTLYVFDLRDMVLGMEPKTIELKTYPFVSLQTNDGKVYVNHQQTIMVKNEKNSDQYWRYDQNYKNFVVEIDVSDPSDPELGDEYNIPGRLIGAQDGALITISRKNNDADVVLLNTLSLKDGKATVLAAVKLGTGWFETVYDDGMVYAIKTTYGYDHEAHRSIPPVTILKVIDVRSPAAPTLVLKLKFEGSIDLQYVGDGHMVLYDYSRATLLVYSTEALPKLKFEAMVLIYGYSSQISIHGDSLFVIQGYYGVTTARI